MNRRAGTITRKTNNNNNYKGGTRREIEDARQILNNEINA